MPLLLPPSSLNASVLARVRDDFAYSWPEPTSPILNLLMHFTAKNSTRQFLCKVRLQMFFENTRLCFSVFCFDKIFGDDT